MFNSLMKQFSAHSVNTEPCADIRCGLNNSICLPEPLLCDGHNDCGDNSDEFGCGKRPILFSTALRLQFYGYLVSFSFLNTMKINHSKRSSYLVISCIS